MKKIFTILLCNFFIFGLSHFVIVNAEENENSENEINEVNEEEFLQEVEEYFYDKNTTVIDELNDTLLKYQNQSLNTSSDVKKTKINKLINTVNLCIDNCNLYYTYMTYNLNERILLPPSISDIVIASAIAYFEYNDWDLSAELLMHSFNNEELDSIYLPVNQDIVSEGTFSKEIVADTHSVFGNAEFRKTSNTIDDDLYFSIKNFQYVKEYEDEDSIIFHIRDRYDFDAPERIEDIVDTVVTLMSSYEDRGILTPFISDIKVSMIGCADYSYEISSGKAIINNIDNDVDSLSIPNMVLNINSYDSKKVGENVEVIKIGAQAARNRTNLNSIILPEGISIIEDCAFENCVNLNYISLSSSLIEIGNYVFNNCSSLYIVSLPKNIETVGYSVFDNCLSLTNIFVDFPEIFKYVNNPNLLPYKSLFECDEKDNLAEYNFNCRTTKLNENIALENDEKFLYKLNIDCQIQYEIEAESNKKIIINIYKSDYTLLEKGTTIQLSSGKYLSYSCPLLERGEYYIEICYSSMEDSGTINYLINPHTSTDDYISTDDEVDVLTHLHENKNEFIISPSKSGLFLLELFSKVDGKYINPNGEFIIKNSSGEIVQKMNLSEYNHQAESIVNANNIMFYANQWGGYTVYLEVADLQYDELTLKVNEVEDFTIYDMDEDDKYISNSNIQIGDFAYIYNLERIGTYNITFEYQGTQSDEMLFVLFETNEQGEYVYKESYEINNSNRLIELVEVITYSKNLLLCVFDSEGLGNLSIDISKELNNEFTIYGASDPSASLIHLTKGFQEICYLGADAPNPASRYEYYNWYSTNESVILVSAYGTVTAVGVGEAKVQCVYKADTSIVATLDFEVVDDPLDNGDEANDIYLTYGFDVRTGGTISGTEVTSGKGAAISVGYNPYVSIHVTYTRLICLGSDSPNSSVQSFNWRAYREGDDTGMVNVSQFGTITGVTSGWVTIEGTYKYNSRYKINIRIYVESNI